MSTPIFGLCPVGRDWMKESSQDSGMDWIKAPPEAPRGRDATDEVMTNLARKKINVFSGIGHGFYFWNFRTDVSWNNLSCSLFPSFTIMLIFFVQFSCQPGGRAPLELHAST